ncbi:MAG: sugar phosphate isomerase/epimerase [Deltaproteobacteria bacterium]|nr:sugar phosphate isomerase/epimerase [Deltaproteobacteria bacterium]
MQGRLLPKYKGRYQAFPVGSWEKEFAIAAGLGLGAIEFILDYNDYEKNPLMSRKGVKQINEFVDKTGVKVKTVCADYFMEAPMHGVAKADARKSVDVLLALMENSNALGVTDIIIPCVDQSSLNGSERNIEQFVENISMVIDAATSTGINLSLETDLGPSDFLNLLNMFDSKKVTVNYDIGNSAALGFDPDEEFSAYGKRISELHIKDRILKGGSVMLGQGNADFEKVFRHLHNLNFDGPIIMQVFRDDEGVEVFKKQLEWIKPFLNRYFKI